MDLDFLIPGGALSGPLFASLLNDGPDPAQILAPGTRIGAYRIGELLGRGGGGVVYCAERDDGSFAQTVALKIVRPGPHQLAFLRRERNILGQLTHPGIARIYDGGETENGEAWYAMERIEGERIDHWCRLRQSDWRSPVQLLVRVCEAVGYAHSRLIVHRDLKPSNLLVTEQGQPKLLDFGISRDLHDSEPGDAGVAFTPAFASPEQLTDGSVTTASDIFQLGRLLQMLLLQARTHGGATPDPLSARQLQRVLQRASAELPADRHASVDALRIDLLDVLAQRPARSLNWPWRWRAALFLRRHWLAVLPALAFIVSIGALTWVYTGRLSAERDRAQSEAQRALVANEVLANLHRTAAPLIAAGDEPSATELIDRGVANTLQRFADAPVQRAIAVETLAAAYVDLGARDKARALLTTALEQLDADAPAWALQRARLRLNLLRVDLADNRGDDGEPRLREISGLLDQGGAGAGDRDWLEYLRCEWLDRNGQGELAGLRRNALIASLQRGADGDDTLLVELLRARSLQHSRAMDLKSALADLDTAQTIERGRFGPASPQVFELQRRQVWLLLRQGWSSEVEHILQAQRTTVAATFGAQSLEFGNVRAFEGMAAIEGGKPELARTHFQAALDILRPILGVESLVVASALHNLAESEVRSGDSAQGLLHFREALAIRRLRLPEQNQQIAANRISIAKLSCAAGDMNAAESEFVAARAALLALTSPRHANVLGAAVLHADCLLSQGQVMAARRIFDEVVVPAGEVPMTANQKQRLLDVRSKLEQAERLSPPKVGVTPGRK